MSAAEDRDKRLIVQVALEELLTAKPMTRAELFDGAPSKTRTLQREVIDRLVSQGIAEKQNDGGDPKSPTVIIKLKDRRRLEQILNDDRELTRIIWPGSVAPEVTDAPPKETAKSSEFSSLEEPPAPELTPGAPLPAPIPPKLSVPPQDNGLGLSTEELLQKTLIVLDAACQSIIYTRDKVIKLEKIIKEMDAKVTVLYEGLK